MGALPDKQSITAVILAGGRGSRMGGVDKGLQLFNSMALAQHTLMRLAPQVGSVIINANRNLKTYEAFGVPVFSDDNALGEFAGPLAGVMTALQNCKTPYLLTVPCDAPLFPADLAARLATALSTNNADIGVASALESTPAGDIFSPQPVFSLMKVNVLKRLLDYTQSGGRKVSRWMALHRLAFVPFNQPHDVQNAFFNANTLADLDHAQSLRPISL